jgi:hypothetical protein
VGLFTIKEHYPGANTNTKRALSQADLNSPAVAKLKEAAKLAKLKIESPVWRETAWAHIAIPSKKVTVAVFPHLLTNKSQGFRNAWDQYGWKCLCIGKLEVEGATTEELARDLLSAIGEVWK